MRRKVLTTGPQTCQTSEWANDGRTDTPKERNCVLVPEVGRLRELTIILEKIASNDHCRRLFEGAHKPFIFSVISVLYECSVVV